MTRLKECRERARFTQKQVAVTLGIAAPSVANWESGKTNPAHENLVRLADLYGVSVDYLLGRAGEQDDKSPDVSDIDFAISGEMKALNDREKQDVLDYIRFKRSQRVRV